MFHLHCSIKYRDLRCSNSLSNAVPLKFYYWLNVAVCAFISFLIAVVLIAWFCDWDSLSSVHWAVTVMFIILLLVYGSRSVWLRVGIGLQFKIVDDPSAFELERMAFLAWAGLLGVVIYRSVGSHDLWDSVISTVAEWFIILLLWSPIVTLVGSSWRKLYVYSDKGKVFWPRCPKCSIG